MVTFICVFVGSTVSAIPLCIFSTNQTPSAFQCSSQKEYSYPRAPYAPALISLYARIERVPLKAIIMIFLDEFFKLLFTKVLVESSARENI